jgi:hypothetical protein
MMIRVVILCALSVGLTTVVRAQTSDAPKVTPDSENGRFSMSPVSEGVMRLDTRTGQVSLCRKRDVWTCETVADDRAAYEKEIGRLQQKITGLEAELGRGTNKGSDLKLPTEAELDRVMKFFENVFRRFIGMIEGLQREKQDKGT